MSEEDVMLFLDRILKSCGRSNIGFRDFLSMKVENAYYISKSKAEEFVDKWLKENNIDGKL